MNEFNGVDFLKKLRTTDNVVCPICKKGIMKPDGKKETTFYYECTNCKETVIIN